MTHTVTRRHFLGGMATGIGALGGMAAGCGLPDAGTAPTESFTFAHLTDCHITRDRAGDKGTAQCFLKTNELAPDFAIAGGDQLMDIMGTNETDARGLFELWEAHAQDLHMPVHYVIGNHDAFGIGSKNTVPQDHTLYGREFFKDRMGEGATYRSFDHKNWHFIILDSIGMPPERGYFGDVDEAQMDWLKADLAATGPDTPVIVTTHIPLITLSPQVQVDTWTAMRHGLVVRNGRDIRLLLEQYNVKMVLQGHIHILEQMEYGGIQYITSNAVCSDWWRGHRYGIPEGFGMITCAGETATWRYQDFGWNAEAAQGGA